MESGIITQDNFRIISPLFVLIYFLVSASSCNQEVSVTPPDAPPPNGYVFINSNPTGFNIYLDNKERRRATPDSITWLSTGTYLLTLKKYLYNDTSVTLNIVEGEKASVFIDIAHNQSMYGNLYCTSYPSKADIFINDSSTGRVTPYTFNILPGQYNVKYHFKNHRDAGISTSVSSNSTSTAYLALVDTTLWKDFNLSNSKIFSNSLTCIAIDPGDIMYIGTSDAGFFSFEEKKDLWIPYHNTLSTTINCLTFDKKNILYVGTKAGMVVFTGTGLIEYGPGNSTLPSYNINAFTIDNEGQCYIASDKGINLFGKWTNFTPSIVENGKKVNPKVSALSIDINGNLWAGVNGYGIAENSSSNSWTLSSSFNINLINNYITALASSASGEVWAGFDRSSATGNGLSYFNGSSWNKVYPISTTCKTSSIFIDRNNNKWVATDQGLVMFSSPSNATTFNYNNTGLDINDVKGVTQDSYGNIWIATSAGLYKYKGAR